MCKFYANAAIGYQRMLATNKQLIRDGWKHEMQAI